MMDLFCLVAPPALWCVRCYDRATSSTPAAPTTLVVPDERKIVGDAKLVDSGNGGGVPVGNTEVTAGEGRKEKLGSGAES